MGKLDELKEKINNSEIQKSWQYMLYIAGVLPGAVYLLAWLLRDNVSGVMLARLFHTYNLYVSSPVPNLDPFNGVGVLGLVIMIALVVWAVRRKDWSDLALTIGIGAVNAVYFWMEWNYQLLRFISLM